MRPGDQTQSSASFQPLHSALNYLARPLHRFCRRRSSLTLSISFVGVVLLAKMGPDLKVAISRIVRAIESRSLIGGFVENLSAWERVTATIAEVVSLLQLVMAPLLAALIIAKPRRAGALLILMLAICVIGGGGENLQFELEMISFSRWPGQSTGADTSLVPRMTDDLQFHIRCVISAAVFPAVLGLWYVLVARRHLRSSVEFDGRRWDPAPPVWRSLVAMVLVAILIQFWDISDAILRVFARGVLAGNPFGFEQSINVGLQCYGFAVAILALACGILICALRRRRLWVYMLALAVVLVLSRATYYALLEGIDEKQRNWWSYLREYAPILAALTALFCYAQENDWTAERHVVCGSCGYFMGGAEGSKCPECGAARPEGRDVLVTESTPSIRDCLRGD